MMKTILLMLLICAMPARAELLTGEDLHMLLTGTEAQQAQGLAYIKGAHDAGQSAAHCAPPLTDAYLLGLVRMVLARMPAERAAISADHFVNTPLQMSFPCRRSVRGEVKGVA